jgi:hypothetical protein
MTTNKKCKLQTALLTFVRVYHIGDYLGKPIGKGYIVYYNEEMLISLIDKEGNNLTTEWYDLEQLEQKLVVTTKEIQ